MKLLAVVIFISTCLVAEAADLSGDRTALITGANRGIGLGLVEVYLDRGWNVIATARTPARADALRALAMTHPRLAIEQLDVTDHGRVDELAETYRDQPIDVLINNAAYIQVYQVSLRPLAEVEFDDTRMSFEVNAIGPMKMAQAFTPHVAASRDKKLINISSSAASFGAAPARGSSYNYSISKTALNAFTFKYAAEVRERGVIVTALHPGVVETDRPGNDWSVLPPAMQRIPRMTVEEATAKIVDVIDSLTSEDSGRFVSYDGGTPIPW